MSTEDTPPDTAPHAPEEGALMPVEDGPLPEVVLLNGEIEILTQRRLSHLDRGPVQAFAARNRGDVQEKHFALICENHLLPRTTMAGKFAGIVNPGIVRLVASGVANWPAALGQRYVLVYENTLGPPLMKNAVQGGLGWKQDSVMKNFIHPMVAILRDLRDADMVHGCINPMNIFGGGEDGMDRIVLGECLATPPSFLQPVAFEPVERSMADPIAKGTGTFEDDLYAFGVVITTALRTKDPLAGMSRKEIIRHKIETGSYAALTGKERFTGAILELLRGLLYDDRAQRWTLDEIEAWMDGQRLSPKQNAKKQKAARPLHFNGERYHRPLLLAMDMEDNPAEAVQTVDGGALEQWLSRSLEDGLTRGRLEQALETARENGRGPGYWDRLLSRVSIALDPEAPLRFKGKKIHPEGFSWALAEAVILKKDLMPFADIIAQQLVMFWLGAQHDIRVDVGNLLMKFDSCRAFLRQSTIGYGIERCLYFLSAECPCVSDRLAGYYVRDPDDLMAAFESMADSPKRPELFIDRHIAAFLSVRDRRMIDPFFSDLNADEYHRRVLGHVKVLATVQKRARLGPFPGISGWVADILDPVYERYHDRELRVALRAKIDKLRKSGDLVRIVTVLDDNQMRQRDFLGFKKAMEEYAAIRKEEEDLHRKLARPASFGRETGQEVAAIVAGLLSGIFILALAFLHFTGGGLF